MAHLKMPKIALSHLIEGLFEIQHLDMIHTTTSELLFQLPNEGQFQGIKASKRELHYRMSPLESLVELNL